MRDVAHAVASSGRARVCIKREPGDWRVYEQLDLDFADTGEHAYFHVEKVNLNTRDVAQALAAQFAVPEVDVGYAGLKDKHAITRQWFSVRGAGDAWPLDHPQMRCLAVRRHVRKLRRGQHSLNFFEIRLRDADLDTSVAAGLGQEFANFFGPQRTTESNVAGALRWLRRRRRQDPRRGWHLSVLRSLLFNAVLEHRVMLGNYATPVPGDVLLEGVPSGPLWGRGRSAVTDEAAALEAAALEPHYDTCAALEYAGVSQARRKLAQTPGDFRIESLVTSEHALSFTLPPGSYATALLGHRLELVDEGRGA